ncbi:hypothetical protein [Moraxella bovoculi]|uniref:hypothetical protein n=1 Tax=Moraxella bovoculi TaxID=386891 RepID=UPI000624696C|nr:hypothetical protein [Moraxella bovoculi]AKG17517.1 hypothetical protein AAX10_07580 [Moraxella bovoculi]
MFDELSFERIYILASAMIAVLIWIEASWMLKNAGKLPQSALFAWISLMTTAWLVVSGLALFFLDFNGLSMSVPVAYGIYSLMGWIYGARLISTKDIDDPKDIILPANYLNFCRSFALVFALLCGFVLAKPYLPI